MARVIEADESGALTRSSVEPHGNVVILRRESSAAGHWWETTTPAQRVAWLREWIADLPPSPALPPEATHRDSMYD